MWTFLPPQHNLLVKAVQTQSLGESPPEEIKYGVRSAEARKYLSRSTRSLNVLLLCAQSRDKEKLCSGIGERWHTNETGLHPAGKYSLNLDEVWRNNRFTRISRHAGSVTVFCFVCCLCYAFVSFFCFVFVFLFIWFGRRRCSFPLFCGKQQKTMDSGE